MEAFKDSLGIRGMDFQILVKPPPGGVGSWSAEMRVPDSWLRFAPDHVTEGIGGRSVVVGRALDGALATKKLLERFGAAALIVLGAAPKTFPHPGAPALDLQGRPPAIAPDELVPIPPVAPVTPSESIFAERIQRSTMLVPLWRLINRYSDSRQEAAAYEAARGELVDALEKFLCAYEFAEFLLDHVAFSKLSDEVRAAQAEYLKRMPGGR